jgi:hypothetical protein
MADTTRPGPSLPDPAVDNDEDDLDPEDREALNRALVSSYESVLAGDVRPASSILEMLRRRRIA